MTVFENNIEQIELIKSELNESELNMFNKFSINYIDKDLRELQNIVLITFAKIESTLEALILLRIILDCGVEFQSKVYDRINANIGNILETISYKQKIIILNSYKRAPKEIRKSLDAAYQLRNEFAHPRGFKLKEKYDYHTKEGTKQILELFKILKESSDKMGQYLVNELSN